MAIYIYTHNTSLNIMKPCWCTSIHQGLYSNTKSARRGALDWKIQDPNMTKQNKTNEETTFIIIGCYNATLKLGMKQGLEGRKTRAQTQGDFPG